MKKHYSTTLRIISTITLIAFLSTQVAWGYSDNLRPNQAHSGSASGVEVNIAKALGGEARRENIIPEAASEIFNVRQSVYIAAASGDPEQKWVRRFLSMVFHPNIGQVFLAFLGAYISEWALNLRELSHKKLIPYNDIYGWVPDFGFAIIMFGALLFAIEINIKITKILSKVSNKFFAGSSDLSLFNMFSDRKNTLKKFLVITLVVYSLGEILIPVLQPDKKVAGATFSWTDLFGVNAGAVVSYLFLALWYKIHTLIRGVDTFGDTFGDGSETNPMPVPDSSLGLSPPETIDGAVGAVTPASAPDGHRYKKDRGFKKTKTVSPFPEEINGARPPDVAGVLEAIKDAAHSEIAGAQRKAGRRGKEARGGRRRIGAVRNNERVAHQAIQAAQEAGFSIASEQGPAGTAASDAAGSARAAGADEFLKGSGTFGKSSANGGFTYAREDVIRNNEYYEDPDTYIVYLSEELYRKYKSVEYDLKGRAAVVRGGEAVQARADGADITHRVAELSREFNNAIFAGNTAEQKRLKAEIRRLAQEQRVVAVAPDEEIRLKRIRDFIDVHRENVPGPRVILPLNFYVDVSNQYFLTHEQLHDWANKITALNGWLDGYGESQETRAVAVENMLEQLKDCETLHQFLASLIVRLRADSRIYLIPSRNRYLQQQEEINLSLANSLNDMDADLSQIIEILRQVIDKQEHVFTADQIGVMQNFFRDFKEKWDSEIVKFLQGGRVKDNPDLAYIVFLRILFPDAQAVTLWNAVDILRANTELTDLALDFAENNDSNAKARLARQIDDKTQLPGLSFAKAAAGGVSSMRKSPPSIYTMRMLMADLRLIADNNEEILVEVRKLQIVWAKVQLGATLTREEADFLNRIISRRREIYRTSAGKQISAYHGVSLEGPLTEINVPPFNKGELSIIRNAVKSVSDGLSDGALTVSALHNADAAPAAGSGIAARLAGERQQRNMFRALGIVLFMEQLRANQAAAVQMLDEVRKRNLNRIVIVIGDDNLVKELNYRGIKAVEADSEARAAGLKIQYEQEKYFVVIFNRTNNTLQVSNLPAVKIDIRISNAVGSYLESV